MGRVNFNVAIFVPSDQGVIGRVQANGCDFLALGELVLGDHVQVHSEVKLGH